MTPIEGFRTTELVAELARRSPGHVIAVQLPGKESLHLTSYGVDDWISTLGLYQMIGARIAQNTHYVISSQQPPLDPDQN